MIDRFHTWRLKSFIFDHEKTQFLTQNMRDSYLTVVCIVLMVGGRVCVLIYITDIQYNYIGVEHTNSTFTFINVIHEYRTDETESKPFFWAGYNV